MPREATSVKRRSRRSLPSAIERNLSLHELLGDDDAASRRRATRRQSLETQQQQELQSLNAYFAMIDGTQLKVEKQEEPADDAAKPAGSAAASDSELVRPTVSVSAKSCTQRTMRRRNLDDAKLQAEYAEFCDATASAGTPVSIEEFARTIVPQVKTGMYDGILDVCTVEEPQD